MIYEDDVDPPHNVHVNMGEKDFGVREMKRIIGNTGLSRKEFYGSTKETARKAHLPFKKKK